MKIDPKQIPKAVAEIGMLRALGVSEHTSQVYLAAALSVWPGAFVNADYPGMPELLVLPLSKEGE